MRASSSKSSRRAGASLSKHAVLVVMSVLLGFPLLWMVLTSLKTNPQSLAVPIVWWPHPFVWSNYPDVLSAVPFYRFFLNTLLYAAVTIVGVCLSSSLVAYGFSRIRWRGRDVVFQVMVATLLIPFFATLIPLFVMYKRFHMVGWYLPLMVPTFLGSSVFSTFLLRQFFMTIPESLSDAARVDGANEFYIYSRIILPMAKPAMATVILFQFIYCWNDYLGPLVYIDNQVWYPLSLGLYLVLGTYTTNWPWVMASATAATAPIIILFFLTQRTFMEGISIQGTGVKG
ncbi:MAG TPA: carbohydrate ABC transporter permease [Acidimicrobiales bacterium]|nr:carbohydrate ABC transporter permease [Acidimicrobiales bacterium]